MLHVGKQALVEPTTEASSIIHHFLQAPDFSNGCPCGYGAFPLVSHQEPLLAIMTCMMPFQSQFRFSTWWNCLSVYYAWPMSPALWLCERMGSWPNVLVCRPFLQKSAMLLIVRHKSIEHPQPHHDPSHESSMLSMAVGGFSGLCLVRVGHRPISSSIRIWGSTLGACLHWGLFFQPHGILDHRSLP